MRNNPIAPPPPPPPVAQLAALPVALPVMPSPPPMIEQRRCIPVDKVRKYRAKEFQGSTEDDPSRAEYSLENTESSE